MKIAFRADASIDIGTGHIMRCLTLADALLQQGAECSFICREHTGNMVEAIRQRGFDVQVLPDSASQAEKSNLSVEGDHAAWLGCTWEQDAEVCGQVLQALQPDWVVVDHYALDARWQRAVSHLCKQIMVIDDLADRPHACQLLLDQNLGREDADYKMLVPDDCHLMTGPTYALLRSEFAEWREKSLDRRGSGKIGNILISMGGGDKPNATGVTLSTLADHVPAELDRVTVVVGANAPWLSEIQMMAKTLPWPVDVRVNVSNMAELMSQADLSIGAAGGTSWERCCLGLPTLLVVLAENQRDGAAAMQASGAASVVGEVKDIPTQLPVLMSRLSQPAEVFGMSERARQVADGRGVERVVQELMDGC